jgi:DNA-binding IclR family transcriptional regulator
MLATLTPRQLRALFAPNHRFVQRNGTGPGSLSELRTLLHEAREAGYAQENGSVTPGFASVGCAVLDHGGYPAAAVALTFPAHELGAAARAALAVRVQAAARQLSRAIGGAPSLHEARR